MRSLGFLSTTVGRRLFARFLLTAFVPAAITAALAVVYVQSQLRDDNELRVTQHARRAGLTLFSGLDRRAWLLQAAVPALEGSSAPPGFAEIRREPIGWGAPLADGASTRLTAEQRDHLATGQQLLVVDSLTTPPSIWMGLMDTTSTARSVIWGRLDGPELWTPLRAELGSDSTILCVETVDGTALDCQAALPAAVRARVNERRGAGQVGTVRFEDGDRVFRAASWNAFLKYEYGSADWRVIVLAADSDGFAAARRFTLTLAGILSASLLGVFLLSHTQIRRTTEPLRQLQEGTKRLAAGDFSTAVTVSSEDEYAQLATSFNGMARVLNRQLTMLQRLDGLNAAVLGARELPHVLTAATNEIGLLHPSAIVLAWVNDGDTTLRALRRDRDGSITFTGPVPRIDLSFEPLVRRLPQHEAQRLTSVLGRPCATVFLAPFTDGLRSIGCVAIAFADAMELEPERSHAIRRLVDRLGLAVVEVLHVQHLDALGAGTLTAFARAIDANSPWTAGHSERVTETALLIGRRLQLTPHELGVLRRGGLLHDIGKIGVPPHILDKAGPLTAAERQVIERHPVLGAEILEPIGPFNDVIPIVRSHHEKMDGTGYPDRLSGDSIPYLARVLAVADVFDALVSHRPYRSGMDLETAVRIIRSGTGSHFDADPAAAFLAAAADGEVERLVASTGSSHELAIALDAGRKLVEAA